MEAVRRRGDHEFQLDVRALQSVFGLLDYRSLLPRSECPETQRRQVEAEGRDGYHLRQLQQLAEVLELAENLAMVENLAMAENLAPAENLAMAEVPAPA